MKYGIAILISGVVLGSIGLRMRGDLPMHASLISLAMILAGISIVIAAKWF